MSELKLAKEDFSEIEGVVAKKLRNKKKKMDKIIATENKIVAKEIVPTDEQKEMVASKNKVDAQIKELEEMKRILKKESDKVLAKHNKIVKELKSGEANQEKTIQRTLTTVADALLVNLLQNEYNVKNLLGSDESVGLEAILVPLKNLVTPPHEQLVYSRARDCFVQVFQSFVSGSEDIIPGSGVTHSHLLAQIHNLPESVRQETHSLAPKAEPAHLEQAAEQPAEEVKVAADDKLAADWNAADEDDEHDEPADEAEQEHEQQPSAEQLAEEDVKRDMVRGKKEFLKHKGFVDEDGFVHVKPHDRPSYEHDYLRGRGRRGRKGRHGETDRYKVRGGKGPRGFRGGARGGAKHHDKHDVDETGRKVKTAHGKHPNWSKGEVRVDREPQTQQ
jgi:hypothetical protein